MVSHELPPVHSGAGLQAVALAKELRANGVKVWMLTSRYRGEAHIDSIEGIPVRQIGVFGHRGREGYLAWVTFGIGALSALFTYHRHWRIAHIHGAYTTYIGPMFASFLLRRPMLIKVTLMGDDELEHVRARRLGSLWLALMKRANRFIALTPAIGVNLARSGVPPDRIVGVPNGVDVAKFAPLSSDRERLAVRRDLGLPEKGVLLGFVGAIIERKKVLEVVTILRGLVDEKLDCHFVAVGSLEVEPDYVLTIRKAAADAGVADRVILTGESDQVRRYLQATNIFFHLSNREGLPNSVLEAMSTALPVLSGNVPGLDALIKTGDNAYIVEDGVTPGQLTELTKSFVEDPLFAQRVGQAARRTIVERFSLETIGHQYQSIYRTLAGGD